jgi:hypothetical protein
MVKPSNPNRSYNEYRPQKGEGFERRHKATFVSDVTLKALEELEFITSWAEFVAICAEQKRKRGW